MAILPQWRLLVSTSGSNKTLIDSPQPDPPKPSFFAELKRRRVIRVAITYVVAAWIIIQVASATFSGFGIPLWAFRFVVLMLVL